MIIQATPYGTKKEESFAFTYSGDFTDERVDGVGDVTLNTSGTLVTSGKTVTVSAYILGAGGGAAVLSSASPLVKSGGGGGGNQTIEVILEPGTYEIIIGIGGNGIAQAATSISAGNGGNTTAFGYTSTGGQGGYMQAITAKVAAGGEPDGNAGTTKGVGGSPNGGNATGTSSSNYTCEDGGNGLVRITFS